MTSHPDNFQDWTTVVLRNKSAEIKKRNAVTEVQKKYSGNQLPKNIEQPQPLVTTELKQKCINTRTALKLTREKLACGINVKLQDINLLENGKITLKEAKQIAIKIERKYRVKILEIS